MLLKNIRNNVVYDTDSKTNKRKRQIQC